MELTHSLMECPVCLEVAKGTVQQCSNGHVACSECAKKLPQCPLCQLPFLQQKPTCLNNLLEVLPLFCRYKEAGCKQLFVAGDEHEQYCGFRPVFCRNCMGEETLKVNDILQHYCEMHVTQFCLENQTKFSEINFCKQNFTSSNISLIFDSTFFNIKLEEDSNGSALIWFEAFFVGKPNSEYYLTLKFENCGYVVQKTMKSIFVLDEIKSKLEVLSEIGETENLEDYCMRVPQMFFDILKENKKEDPDVEDRGSDSEEDIFRFKCTFTVYKK